MSTVNISLAERIKQYNTLPVQKSSQPAASEPGALNNSTDSVFGLLMGQLLGVALQNVPQGEASHENAGTVTVAQTPVPLQGTMPQNPEISNLLLGVQSTKDAPRDGETESQLSKLLSGNSGAKKDSVEQTPTMTVSPDKLGKVDKQPDGETGPQLAKLVSDTSGVPKGTTEQAPTENVSLDKLGKVDSKLVSNTSDAPKGSAEQVPTENLSSDKTGNGENQTLDNKKGFYLSALMKGSDPEAQKSAAGPHGKNEAEQGAGEAGADKIDFASQALRESSAVQQQPVHALGTRGVENAAGSQHVSVHAADPAEVLESTVSIIKDGNRLMVKLEPGGLGKLDINLNLKDGMINAQINVHDDATKNLIEKNMQQIVDALQNEGLSVGGFSVSMNKGNGWEGAAESQQQYGGQGPETALAAIDESGRAPARGLVNIFV